MPYCRDCGQPFEWGWDSENDRWVLLEPASNDSDLFKSFMDENGVARADHRDRCGGGITVAVTRLRKKIPPEPVDDVDYRLAQSVEHGNEMCDESIGDAQDAAADEKGWFAKMRGK